jgi:hypothetical protein
MAQVRFGRSKSFCKFKLQAGLLGRFVFLIARGPDRRPEVPKQVDRRGQEVALAGRAAGL